MVEPPDMYGFWSYARSTDPRTTKHLGALCARVTHELQLGFGKVPEIKIFRDLEMLPGAPWTDEIENALADSSFFIAILKPSFLQRERCGNELLRFSETEAKMGRRTGSSPFITSTSTPSIPTIDRMCRIRRCWSCCAAAKYSIFVTCDCQIREMSRAK